MSTTSASGCRPGSSSSSSAALAGRRDVEALLAQAAHEQGAELGVVLQHDDLRVDHCLGSIAFGDHEARGAAADVRRGDHVPRQLVAVTVVSG